MGLFDAIDISGSGLSAERLRMDVTAENLANTINEGFQYEGIGNAVCPANFPSGHVVAIPCGSAIRADSSANGGKGAWIGVVDLRSFDQRIVNVKT